ncbi:hypothetical protein [Bacillus sp. MMSF_3328]|uniref:hypothetical protein n=1 Tax=Bacillus sp. MMSF_3328 TaxID=3047080 RepID=UPI00273F4BD9|nr:hypothetical protein [Bacillus sp. MMSF_3328]
MRLREDIENPMVLDSLWRNRTMNDDYFADLFEPGELDEEVCCSVCRQRMLKEDEPHESQIWEDTWLCDNRACHNKHYQGWAESMELQKYYIKQKKHSSGNEHFFQGIVNK